MSKFSTKPIFSPKANTATSSVVPQPYTEVFPKLYSEGKESTAVLAFGRLNPPTTGHAKLVDKIHEVGEGHHKELVVSHSQDSKKNPLSPSQKIKHLKRYFPGTKITAASKDEPTLIHHAKRLNQAGHQHLVFVAGSDRTHQYKQLLNKYNGKEYKFKSIKVVSAGKRDPDAEGAEGMSASKMREHAKSGNFKEFRKGVPTHVSDQHAKELYHDVRHSMKLTESVHTPEPPLYKAMFLVGGPGSGKDFLLKRVFEGCGLTEISAEKIYDHLMHSTTKSLSKLMISDLRSRLVLEGSQGIIVNGSAEDADKIVHIAELLESVGYSTAMTFVSTTDESSQHRNQLRGHRGGRCMTESIRHEKWERSQQALDRFKDLFEEDLIVFDNSIDLLNPQIDLTITESKNIELTQIRHRIDQFLTRDSQDPIAYQLFESIRPALPDHPRPDLSDEIAELGLRYYGFGRYGTHGLITHHLHENRLIPVDSYPKRSIKESQIIEEQSETMIDQLAKKHGVSHKSIMAQLEMGIEVEMEHTKDQDIALKIALDHLKERPDYYTKLKTLEQSPKQKLSFAQVKKKMQETTYGYDETTPQQWGPDKDEWNMKMGGRAGAPVKSKTFLIKKS
jgi:hypothetical protein